MEGLRLGGPTARKASGLEGLRLGKPLAWRAYGSESELQETLHWIHSAIACSYLSEAEGKSLIDKASVVGRLLGSTIKNYESFCSP